LLQPGQAELIADDCSH